MIYQSYCGIDKKTEDLTKADEILLDHTKNLEKIIDLQDKKIKDLEKTRTTAAGVVVQNIFGAIKKVLFFPIRLVVGIAKELSTWDSDALDGLVVLSIIGSIIFFVAFNIIDPFPTDHFYIEGTKRGFCVYQSYDWTIDTQIGSCGDIDEAKKKLEEARTIYQTYGNH